MLRGPIQINPAGAVFSSDALFCKPVVRPLVGLLIEFSLYQQVVEIGIRLLADVRRAGRFPYFELGVAALGFLLATAAEAHAHAPLPLAAAHV